VKLVLVCSSIFHLIFTFRHLNAKVAFWQLGHLTLLVVYLFGDFAFGTKTHKLTQQTFRYLNVIVALWATWAV
jgi:hypothetical protein